MKIAIVCQTEKRHHRDRFGNGIQAVERMQARILADHGHEIVFIVPSDSETVFDDISVIKLGGVCEESLGEMDRSSKSRLNRTRTHEIENYIFNYGFNLVINHSFSSALIRMCVKLTNVGIPACTFIHCNPEDAFDISIFAKINLYHKLTLAGGSVVCVSNYQRLKWQAAVKKRLTVSHISHITPIEIDQIFTDVCGTTALTSPLPVLPAADFFIMLGRPAPDKNIHKLLAGLTKMNVVPHVKIYISFAGELTDNEYYMTRMKPYLDKLPTVELYCNHPRDELIADLRSARAIFIPMLTETSSVAAIEAMSYGVSAICFCREVDGVLQHALFEVIKLPHFVPVSIRSIDVFHEQLQTAITNLNITQMDHRQAVQTAAFINHGVEIRYQELETLINKYAKSIKQISLLQF